MIIYYTIYSILYLELAKRIIYKDLKEFNVNKLLDFYSIIGFLDELLKSNI